MATTRHDIAEKIGDYFHQRITLEGLANWAENAQLKGGYEEKYFDAISEVLARIGKSKVKKSELTLNDIDHFLQRLDYSATIGLVPKT